MRCDRSAAVNYAGRGWRLVGSLPGRAARVRRAPATVAAYVVGPALEVASLGMQNAQV